MGTTTLSALASEPAQTELWHNPTTPIPHTKVGQGADLILVAPATAKLLAAYRMGYSHDLLTNTLIATRAPVIVCPAMHTEMWEHPSVVDNVDTLRRRGVHVVEPESGRLAGGDEGAGRLASPESIVAAAERVLGPQDLAGVRVIVSAGWHAGTDRRRSSRSPIEAPASRAMPLPPKPQLVAPRSPSCRPCRSRRRPAPPWSPSRPPPRCKRRSSSVPSSADVIVMAAAVADFRPVAAAAGKIKKHDGVPEIVLEPTPDILAGLGAAKPAGQILVGFAAETDDLVANAHAKLTKKHLDLIVANDVGLPEVGFAHDTNAVTLLRPDAEPVEIDLAAKRDVARAVINTIVEIRAATQTGKD